MMRQPKRKSSIVVLLAALCLITLLTYLQANPLSAQVGFLLDTAPNDHLDLTRAGGFCPATVCPIDRDTTIHDAWNQEPLLPDELQADTRNKWAKVTVLPGREFASAVAASGKTMKMLVRDTKKDVYISGALLAGKVHDPPIRKLIVRVLNLANNNAVAPVFIDVGANIGYFSLNALALGATVISFEPFRDNMGVLMSSVRANGWQNMSFLYMNAVSYESTRVRMRTTNAEINLSNMKISGKDCKSASAEPPMNNETYGLDYMEAVSLDQVMLTRHPNVHVVDLMKIDVETFEVEVLNGAMLLLCNRIVKRIVMEVLYLAVSEHNPNPTCDFESMHERLAQMGYTTWDPNETRNLTGLPLSKLTNDVIFRLEYVDEAPAKRLEAAQGNPCQDFHLQEVNTFF